MTFAYSAMVTFVFMCALLNASFVFESVAIGLLFVFKDSQ